MTEIFPLPEHKALDYPHNLYDWDHEANVGVETVSHEVITQDILEIAEEDHLLIGWGVEGIDQRHMGMELPFRVSMLWMHEGGGAAIKMPDTFEFEFTWLDLWRACDQIARLNCAVLHGEQNPTITHFEHHGDGKLSFHCQRPS